MRHGQKGPGSGAPATGGPRIHPSFRDAPAIDQRTVVRDSAERVEMLVSCRSHRPPWLRGIAVALGLALLTLGTATGLAARASEASVPRGDAAARLPDGALASESWDVVAHFDSGHMVMATVALFNAGLGARNALAFGQLVEPDGTVHPFSRSERTGGWRLDASGRRLDLGSIVLDQSETPRRFVVDKNELGIEVVIEAGGHPAWPAEEFATGCAIDVLEIAGPATGSFRIERGNALPLRGLAAVTHRWMPGLEAHCLRRGLELFAMQRGLGLYLREIETPAGERRSWLVLQRDGVVGFQGPPSDSQITWRAGRPGYPEPTTLRFHAPGMSGRVAFGDSLGRFEPLARLPAPLRLVLEQRTRPRLQWSESNVELTLDGASESGIRGAALAKLTWTNPIPDDIESDDLEALPEVGDPEPGGE